MSKTDYEVAGSRVLGSMCRLGTDLPASSLRDSSSGFDLSTPKSMTSRARVLFSRQSIIVLDPSKTQKVHSKLCRMKTLIKKALRCSKTVVVCKKPEYTPCPGPYSTPNGRSVGAKGEEMNNESTSSIFSENPTHTVPLLPVSKIVPNFAINNPRDKVTSTIAVEHDRGDGEGGIYEGVFHVAPLHLRLPKLSSVPNNRASEGDATLYYTSSAMTNEDVFYNPDADTGKDCLVSELMMELCKVMEQTSYGGMVTPSLASTALRVTNPSLLPKLRHTSFSPNSGFNSDSLRIQYSASEFESGLLLLKTSTMRASKDNEDVKILRIAPSLEKGLHANSLEIYEENMVAAAAPIIRGVYPDVIDIRQPKLCETYKQEAHIVSNRHRSEHDLTVGLLILPDMTHLPCPTISNTSSSEHLPAMTAMFGTTLPFMTSKRMLPVQVPETLVSSGTCKESECWTPAAGCYDEVVKIEALGIESGWDAQEQRFFPRIGLVLKFDLAVRHGHLQQDILRTAR